MKFGGIIWHRVRDRAHHVSTFLRTYAVHPYHYAIHFHSGIVFLLHQTKPQYYVILRIFAKTSS